jgi:hypothetical protein
MSVFFTNLYSFHNEKVVKRGKVGLILIPLPKP